MQPERSFSEIEVENTAHFVIVAQERHASYHKMEGYKAKQQRLETVAGRTSVLSVLSEL